jgi:predicted nuclease of predicted toxin-antitoxin system
MKLLFDHNLSYKLVQRLADIFPDSTQTRLLNFSTANDLAIWNYAKENSFVILTLDKDFFRTGFAAAENHLAALRQFNGRKSNVCCARILRTLKILKRIQRRKFWKSGRKKFLLRDLSLGFNFAVTGNFLLCRTRPKKHRRRTC